ncbi:MAG: hypothetical protein QXO32_06270 [Candidatus Bathyarchaeia archaeon]
MSDVKLIVREGTPMWLMLYGVYVHVCLTSLRRASKALELWLEQSHVALWLWVQKLAGVADRFKVEGVACILIDEAGVQVGGCKAWVWLAFEPFRQVFLGSIQAGLGVA